MPPKAGSDGFVATAAEMNSLEQAMKDPKFRDLLADYAKEISDPENRKRNEMEIKQMESEQGNDVKFINPEPGFVVKTQLQGVDGAKVFINIAESDTIEKPVSTVVKRGKQTGTNWSLPHSTTTHRDDTDKKGGKCIVYDAVFHPQALRLAREDGRVKDMLVQTSLDGIENRFPIHKFDRDAIKFPKMKFKGSVHRSMIREKKQPNGETVQVLEHEEPSAMEKLAGVFTKEQKGAKVAAREDAKKAKAKKVKPSEPKFSIIHRGEFDMMDFRLAPDANQHRAQGRPRELVVTIELPKCVSAAPVELDISAERLTLVCEKPGPYHLDTALPYEVNQDEGKATFDKSRRALIVTLPVIPPKEVKAKHSGIQMMGDDGEEVETEFVMRQADSSAAPAAAAAAAAAEPAATIEEVSAGEAEGRALFAAATKEREAKELLASEAGKAKANAKADAASGEQPKVVEVVEDESEPKIADVEEAETIDAGADDAAATTSDPTSPAAAATEEEEETEVAEVEVVEPEADGTVPFTCHQTDETLSVVLEVAGIADGSVEVAFTEHKFGPLITHSCTVTFETTVDEFVELNQLVLRFDAALHPDAVQVDVSAENAVVVLNKATPAMWRRLRFGPKLEALSEHLFPAIEVTDDGSGLTLKEEGGAWTTDDADADVVVVTRNGDEYHAEISGGGGGGGGGETAGPTTPGSFQASPKFVGSKAGYIFQMGSKGLGYYPDTNKMGLPKSALKKKPSEMGSALPGLNNIFNGAKKGIKENGIFATKKDGSVDYDIDEDADADADADAKDGGDDEPKFVELSDDEDEDDVAEDGEDDEAAAAAAAVAKAVATSGGAAADAPARGFPVPRRGVRFAKEDDVKTIPARDEKQKPIVTRGDFKTKSEDDYGGLGGARQRIYDKEMDRQKEDQKLLKAEQAAEEAAANPVMMSACSNDLMDELE